MPQSCIDSQVFFRGEYSPMSSANSPLNLPLSVFFTNSKTHKKEKFEPISPGKVKFYSCGPTVYDFIHIGNLRAALVADLIYRFLKKAGFEVTYVRNYTDIDDRIINKANASHSNMDAVSKKFIQEVEKDYALALMEEPTHKTLVTEHIREIISMIQKIIENGHAYVVPEGSSGNSEVFFSIKDFPRYGQLSGKSLEDLQAGIRVEIDEKKQNPHDFSLWKPAKPGEPFWESPWGKGRPGWHIECSAMAQKWLGNQMDLHHGGEDLVFPHHENEIAQTEAATHEHPYVRIWLHNAHLNLAGIKMSKSLGNIVSARDFLAQYGGEVARMVMLGIHYRAKFDFNEAALDQALQVLTRIYEAKQKAEHILTKKIALPDPKAEPVWGGFLMDCERAKKTIMEAYAQDLNTAGAIAEFLTLVREWNKCLAHPNAENTPGAILGAQAFVQVLEEEIGSVIGVGRSRSESMLGKLNEIRAKEREARSGGQASQLTDAQIENLLLERKEARAQKNFKRSDEIRAELTQAGVEILDSPQGTTWKRK